MDVETIRNFRKAQPFQPFTLVLLDGRRLPVEVPYRLAISPLANEIAYASRTEGAIFLDPREVRDIERGASVESPKVSA